MLAASTISGGFSFSIPPSPFYPVESKQLPKSAASLSLGHSTLIKTKPIPPSILSPPTFSKEHRILQPQALSPKVNLKTTPENTTTSSSVLSMPPAAIPRPLTPPAAALTLPTTNATPSSPSFSLAVTAAEMTITNTMDSVVMTKEEKIEFETSCGDFKIPEQIQKFEECLQRELQLLGKLKHHFLADPSQLGVDQFDEEPQSAAKLGEELRAIMESKRVALSALMPSLHDTDKMKEQLARVLGKLPQTSLDKIMSITIQPAEVAVANRYLLPVPEVSIAPSFRGTENGTSLIVSVKLFYHGSGKEVATTMQGKQEILQGIKQVNVDKNGKAAFGKLKVMEVSSKHRHQSFCLVFYLEEYSPQGSKRTLTQVKSTPFHVQSRPAKRKREPNGESTGSAEEDEGEESALKKKKKEAKKQSLEEQQQQPQQQTDRTPVAMQDCNYIDITDLLTLPQKEAARRLGISESMLCKRFKECTRRKWPYRYLRKIDKVINMLNLHKSDDGTVPKEDQEKLQRLNKEREECLRPVRIRITSYDRMSPMMRLRSRAADYDEEDIPIDALETLEMLKSSAKGSKRSSKEGGKRKDRKRDKEQSCNNNVASTAGVAAAVGVSVLSKVEDNEEEEASLMMMEDTSASSDSEEMQDTSAAEGGESALESLRASLCASDDEELNSSSSSSDFEINENAKEEESLFDFGKEMGEPKTVTANEQMVVEGEEGITTTTSAPLADSTACSSN